MDTNDENLNSTASESAENEEIEFDDNIDIDSLQAQLQQHMSVENITYEAEKSKTDSDSDSDSTTNISSFSEMFNSAGSDVSVETMGKNAVQPVDETSEIQLNQQPAQNLQSQALSQEKLKLQPGEKKFVIYIEPENLDFIESLSIKERKKVINRVLHYEDKSVRIEKERKERIKFTNQVIIMVLTVVISLPFFFLLLNKSIEITILNYQQAQQNFVKLYKEQGKIKSYKNFQKNFD